MKSNFEVIKEHCEYAINVLRVLKNLNASSETIKKQEEVIISLQEKLKAL